MIFVSLTTTLKYLIMALGRGWMAQFYSGTVYVESVNWTVRQLYWIGYVDWIITSPLILLALTVFAGLPGKEIIIVIIADVTMIVLVRTLMLQNVNDRNFLLL
jgi:bacteriorhodopsin